MGEAILVVRQVPIKTPDPTITIETRNFESLVVRFTNTHDEEVVIYYEVDEPNDPDANQVTVAADSFEDRTITGLNSNTSYTVYAYALEDGQRKSDVVGQSTSTQTYTTQAPTINVTNTETDEVTFTLKNNDTSTVTMYYEVNDSTPDITATVSGGQTITRTIGSLNQNEDYTLYARAKASNENMSSTVSEGFSLGNPESTFAFLHNPASYSGSFRNTWSYQYSHGPAITTSSDGITVQESGYYYVEGAQRSDDNNNGYLGVASNGNRSSLEDRSSGVWTHDHTGRTDRFGHSKYIGYLNSGEKITFGPPNSSDANELRYGEQEYGFLFVLRLDMSSGNFAEDFADYAWKDGPYSHSTTYQNNWQEEGHYGNSLNATNNVREIQVLKDGWYWIESAQRSDGGTAESIIALNGSTSELENNNEVVWVWDKSTSTNTHAHGMCIAYLQQGDVITSGGTSSSGQKYSTTGWAGFLRAIRIDNQGGSQTSRNRIDVGWKKGPTSYVGDQLVNWSTGSQFGTAVSQNGRNLEIEETGHYYFEYAHRPNSSTDAYGTLSSNGNRSTYEDDNSGMWTHDHSSTSANHYHSKWLGPNNSGDLVAAGPDQADQSYVSYGSQSYNGILFVMRLK